MADLFKKYSKYCIPSETFDEQQKNGNVDQRDYVSISAAGKMKKNYISINNINNFFNELFKSKIESNNIETDNNLLFNIQNCIGITKI